MKILFFETTNRQNRGGEHSASIMNVESGKQEDRQPVMPSNKINQSLNNQLVSCYARH